MFFLALLMLLGTSAAHKRRTENGSEIILCDGVLFNDVYFEKEMLFNGLGRPYNLVLHKFSGVLFFSHTIQNGTQIDFGIMACHIEKRKCKEIQGVPGGYAVAYDSGNDDIYFGGHYGIYKYNFLTKSAEFFAEEEKSIWALFVRKNFYYVEYPTQKLYVYQDDNFVKVAEAIDIEIDTFFISRHIDIYFANKTALYKVAKLTKYPIVLNDEIAVRQIAEDAYGDIYFCASDGMYVEQKPYQRVKKVLDIDQAFGMTLDEKDQIIYSDKDAIYRLLPSKYSRLCLNAIMKARNKKEEPNQSHILIS